MNNVTLGKLLNFHSVSYLENKDIDNHHIHDVIVRIK